MKIRFKVTSTKKRHGSRGIAFRRDGQTRDVSREDAEHLLKHWPDNFERVGLSKPTVPPTNPPAKLRSAPLVSILIPQRGRADKLKRCLQLILKNTTYPNYEIILICDRDDMASVQGIPRNKRIRTVVDPSPKRRMFVGKTNYGFRMSKGAYAVYLANDVEVGRNWLTEAMKAMQGAFPDGMGLVAFNHGDPQKHAYHGLISRGFVNKFLKGNIFYPGYIHFWCDLELSDIAKKLGRFCFSPTGRVYHKPVKDSLHAEGWRASYQQGATLLISRSKKGFPL